jgi:hypothetical protein
MVIHCHELTHIFNKLIENVHFRIQSDNDLRIYILLVHLFDELQIGLSDRSFVVKTFSKC